MRFIPVRMESSIGVMQAGQSYYNLIVGGNDQYLFNYKINK